MLGYVNVLLYIDIRLIMERMMKKCLPNSEVSSVAKIRDTSPTSETASPISAMRSLTFAASSSGFFSSVLSASRPAL